MLLITNNGTSGVNPFFPLFARWAKGKIPVYNWAVCRPRMSWLLALDILLWVSVVSLTANLFSENIRTAIGAAIFCAVVLRIMVMPTVSVELSPSTTFAVAPASAWIEHVLHFLPLVIFCIHAAGQPDAVEGIFHGWLPIMILSGLAVCFGPFINYMVFKIKKPVMPT